MKRKPDPALLDDEIDKKRMRAAQLDSDKPRVMAVGCTSFPETVSRIVGDYSSESEREYVVAALVGAQPITLCLSQDVDSELGTCWSMGFLPSEQQWESWNAKIDKEFPITDVEGCLSFFDQTNSNYSRVVINVLVVMLSMTSSNSPSALDDLRNTIRQLQDNLNSVTHVVFSITEHSSCCFYLKNAPDSGTGLSSPVDHQRVLLQIIDDLETCWRINARLIPADLIVFYFTSGIQRASEMYLAKLVISLNHSPNRVLFREKASQRVFNKIMWVTCLESAKDLNDIEECTSSLCHAIRLDASTTSFRESPELRDRLAHACFYQNNRSIERIVITCLNHQLNVKLPRPSAPLVDTTPFSALVELTLARGGISLHLTQLNTGYFPHLAHLTLIDVNISGHLDSHRVPSLKTLRIKMRDISRRYIYKNHLLVHERAQSLIHAGRPWQLVATKERGGWSLASYDPPALNPQDDEKEDVPHSLLLIRELLLLIGNQSNADEWQSQLRGNPSLEAAAGDHSDRLLVWAPQCVQKMTAFCMSQVSVQLEFKEPIPEQESILTSLTCYSAIVVIDGAVLPNLQSFELNGGRVTISGAFPRLEALSFEKIFFQSPWKVDAPLLQSFSCGDLHSAKRLSLNLYSLPHLSFLQITPFKGKTAHCPVILDRPRRQGISHVNEVVFGEGTLMAPFFDRCQMYNVSHLALSMSPLILPKCWSNTEWQCETLTINVCVSTSENSHSQEEKYTVLPLLPFVKTLIVTAEKDCKVLLDSDMPKLINCTVPSPQFLGPNFKCPALQRIRFTEKLSEVDKKRALDPATYVAIGAQPREVFFAVDCQMHTLAWDIIQNERQVVSWDEPLEGVN